MKLTEAQFALLKAVENGDDRCNDSYKPALKLIQLGLCDGKSYGIARLRLSLTEAGRQALKGGSE